MIIASLAIIPAMSLLNRIRGGGFVLLPARGVYWIAPALALMAWLIGIGWAAALIVGLAYLAWGLPGWHPWILGSFNDADCKANWFYSVCNMCGAGTWAGGFFYRHAVFLWPAAAALFAIGARPYGLAVLPFALVASYAIGWWFAEIPFFKRFTSDGVGPSEYVSGVCWGVAVFFS